MFTERGRRRSWAALLCEGFSGVLELARRNGFHRLPFCMAHRSAELN